MHHHAPAITLSSILHSFAHFHGTVQLLVLSDHNVPSLCLFTSLPAPSCCLLPFQSLLPDPRAYVSLSLSLSDKLFVTALCPTAITQRSWPKFSRFTFHPHVSDALSFDCTQLHSPYYSAASSPRYVTPSFSLSDPLFLTVPDCRCLRRSLSLSRTSRTLCNDAD